MKLLKTPAPVLTPERVRALREEINAYLDERVQSIKSGENGASPIEGVPDSVLRNILLSKDGCLCDSYLNIADTDPRS